MNILALDLGTALGFAIFKDGKFISRTQKLETYKIPSLKSMMESQIWVKIRRIF